MDCLALIGPTASGKTEAIQILAELMPIEVVNCDSMQVYQSIPIASQTPDKQTLDKVRHHLIEFVPPSEEYSVSEYIRDARRAIQDIRQRKALPVICGGTGLYYTSLMDGLFDGPSADPVLRETLTAEAAEKGVKTLHDRLLKLDPKAGSAIHPNDIRRVIRALEVIEMTGQNFSEIKQVRSGLSDEMDVRVFGLQWPRAQLYERINRRVDEMLAQGLKDEIEQLIIQPLSKTITACLGVEELSSFFTGDMTLEQSVATLKQNTRRFAKRQIAWFKRDERIQWIQREKSGPSLRESLERFQWLQK